MKKTKQNKLTHVVFLLDQTGSMESLKSDVIGGFNSFLKQQKQSGENIKFSLTLFNSNEIEKRYIDEDINKVKQLTKNNYVPNYMTPLWDAIGKTIQELSGKKEVLFIVNTDGLENASREFKSDSIKELISKNEKDNNWQFLFLGVGLDDFKTETSALSFGTKGFNAFTVSNSSDGITNSYQSLNNTISKYAKTRKLKYESN